MSFSRPLPKRGDNLPALTKRDRKLFKPTLGDFFAHQENFSPPSSFVGCKQVAGLSSDGNDLQNRFSGRVSARNCLPHTPPFLFGFYQFPKADRVNTSFRLCKERLIAFCETFCLPIIDGCVRIICAAWRELRFRVRGGLDDPL